MISYEDKIAEIVLSTTDEEYMPEFNMTDKIRGLLEKHLTDTYNSMYTVVVTIYKTKEQE